MRRVAAQETTKSDECVVTAGENARDRRNLERAGNAIDGDVFVARAVTREAVERAVEESGHDVIVETAGDHAEAKTLGIQIAFERARHSGGIIFSSRGSANRSGYFIALIVKTRQTAIDRLRDVLPPLLRRHQLAIVFVAEVADLEEKPGGDEVVADHGRDPFASFAHDVVAHRI